MGGVSSVLVLNAILAVDNWAFATVRRRPYWLVPIEVLGYDLSGSKGDEQ